MQTLKTVIITLVAVVVLAILAILGVVYSGVYNVAATEKHSSIVYWLLGETVERSIAAHAEAIEVPALGNRRQILAGAAAYESMCAGCHAAPGMERNLAGEGMYPKPPRLDEAAKEMTPAQLFWVIKHGIKASGMPAWGASHSEEEIWSMVALIQKLPEMNAAEYEQLQQAADAAGIAHHHHGENTHPEEEMHEHHDTGATHGEEAHSHTEPSAAHHDMDSHSH